MSTYYPAMFEYTSVDHFMRSIDIVSEQMIGLNIESSSSSGKASLANTKFKDNKSKFSKKKVTGDKPLPPDKVIVATAAVNN